MMRTRPLLILLFILFIPVLAFSQGGQTGAENSLLPEINPQDIEIRSEFQARFPGLRRQPILGFNPKPRVFQVDPNRLPFMESREEAVADISVTELGRPDPPARNKLSIPDRGNAYVRAGFGSFVTPQVNGYLFNRLDSVSTLAVNINYRSSEGHINKSTNNQNRHRSQFQYLDVRTKLTSRLKNDIKLGIEIGGLRNQYDLINSSLMMFEGSTNDMGGLAHYGTTPKTTIGGGGEVSLRKAKNSYQGWILNLGGNLFSFSHENQNNGSYLKEFEEQRFHSSFSYFWPGNSLYETFEVSAEIQRGNYHNTEPIGKQTWQKTDAFIEYGRLLNFSTKIQGKAGISHVADSGSNELYFAPELQVTHNFSPSLSITGAAFAKPEIKNVQEIHELNRFLDHESRLKHSYKTGITGKVQFQLLPAFKMYAGSSFRRVKNYAFFQRKVITQTLSSATGSYDVFHFKSTYNILYANANIFEFYVGANQQIVPEKFWAYGRFTLRSPKFSGGGIIPYEEKLSAEASVSYKILKELTINGWAEYIGTREAPETESPNLDGFLLLNTGAEYQINETFGVYAKLLNILGQKYEIWDGYEERPFQVFGGLTIKF